ncbi:MAG: hypothetical protein H7Y43_07740, partial [Akkermansiaceae bacterium]|nr:hypothetical protein [Verrucomicrobiales bacterium]
MNRNHLFAVSAAVLTLVCPPVSAGESSELVPLKLYRSLNRLETLTAASLKSVHEGAGDYEFVRTEGYMFSTQKPGTLPLKLYWSAERQDHFLSALPQGERDAKTANYELIGIQGYVFAAAQPGTVPLKQYWGGHSDNLIIATKQGERDAATGGYQFGRLDGYVVRDPEAILGERTIDYVPIIAQRRGITSPEIILNEDDRATTPISFKPPVEITIVAKTDSTNLRLAYAADSV